MATARRLALGSALAPLFIALSACGTEPPTPGPLASASPTQSTSPVAAPSPTPTKEVATAPALPEAATRPTAEGAEAFVNYWWKVADYAQHAGDAAAVQRISSLRCEGCNAAIEGIRLVAENHGVLDGGNMSATTSPPTKTNSSPIIFAVPVVVTSAAGVTTYPTKTTRQKARTDSLTMRAEWRNLRWAMVDFK